MTTIVGTVFTKKGIEGDFEWQIKSGLYEDCLFLFNDDEMRRKWKKAGAGNAVIRKYNRYACPSRPRAVGICTGDANGGYSGLVAHAKEVIDDCIQDVRNTIQQYGYKKVYYSAKSPNGLLGTSIFQVNPEVLQYITEQIHKL
jgi:hypothetical protein